MYTNNFLLFAVAAATGASASVLAEKAVQARSSSGGWSLQSSSAVSGLVSCDGGAYCPADWQCFAATVAVAAACCPDSTTCIGAIEGQPSCADSSWSLYKNNQGNGFCCEAGQVGATSSDMTVGAGSCGDTVPSGSSTAVLVSSGTGSPSTSAAASGSTGSAATTTGSSSAGSTSGASVSSSSSASLASSSLSVSSTSSFSSASSAISSSSGSSSSASSASSSGSSGSVSSSSSASASATASSGAIQNSIASSIALLVTGFAVAFVL